MGPSVQMATGISVMHSKNNRRLRRPTIRKVRCFGPQTILRPERVVSRFQRRLNGAQKRWVFSGRNRAGTDAWAFLDPASKKRRLRLYADRRRVAHMDSGQPGNSYAGGPR